VLDTCASNECSLKWNGVICSCAACFDLQGDALVSIYRWCGWWECGVCPQDSGAVLVLRGDDVDVGCLVVDQFVMEISWWIQIGWLNSDRLRLW
jgi:hypothetical protein